MSTLRKGKTKSILESSMDSALTAVEIYNKPRTTFRVETYVTLMVIAWTKLFHAFFNKTIGNTYYYKGKNKRYIIIDGERRAWELADCIKEFQKRAPADKRLSESTKANLILFIKFRNKIEHRHIEKSELETLVFGECQALLFNYESLMKILFDSKYSINESLVFALQFSAMREQSQQIANKRMLAKEYQDIKSFIEKYRTALPDPVFDNQEFSIKFIMVPRVANSSHNDLAMHFVDWNKLSAEEKEKVKELVGIIKDRNIPISNANMEKPGTVVKAGKKVCSGFNHSTHKYLYYVFSVRPIKAEKLDPFSTNTKYCIYDEVHNDYSFTKAWIAFVENFLRNKKMSLVELKEHFDKQEKLDIKDFE